MTVGIGAWYTWHGHVVQIVDRSPADDSEVVVSVIKSAVSETVRLTFVVRIDQLMPIPETIVAGDESDAATTWAPSENHHEK